MKFYIASGIRNCGLVNFYARALEANGWQNTYDWTKQINGDKTVEELAEYAQLEQKAIADSDAVILLLPAGRGAHVELGMALALKKKIYLCAAVKEEFSIENMVAFYQLPDIVRLIGTAEENIEEILKLKKENHENRND